MATTVDLKQVKADFEGDVSICRATWAKVLEVALEQQEVLRDARESVQANRDALYEGHYQPHIGDVPLADKPLIDAEDALLARIDAALSATGAA